jgi:hypothetical protein
MRVHKARHEDTSARVECWFVRISRFEFSRRADRDNFLIPHHNRAIFDDTKRAKGVPTLGSVGEGEKL